MFSKLILFWPFMLAPCSLIQSYLNGCFSWNNHVNCNYSNMTLFPKNKIPNTTLALNLSENFLNKIMVFENIPKLKIIDLSKNIINEIEPRAFDYCPSLEVIDLSWNFLTIIPSDLFYHLTYLKVLNLSNNQFKSFSEDFLFNKLWLEILILDHNPLKQIDAYWFKSCLRLNYLSFVNNQIHQLSSQTFQNMNNLEKIDLSFNNFTHVPIDALCRVTSLKVLKLNHNPIQKLTKNSFKKLLNLKILNINQMPQLIQIENYAFADLYSLKIIEINYNPSLSLINEKAFYQSEKKLATLYLESIFLNNNKLQNLSSILLPWCLLKQVNLSENQWNCDCHFTWTKACLSQSFKNIVCSKPASLSGKNIANLNLNQFECLTEDSNKIEVFHKFIMFCSIILLSATIFVVVNSLRYNFSYWLKFKKRFNGSIYYIHLPSSTLEEE